MAVSYTFQSSAGSSADASSYNFTVDLGTAAADRKILAGVFSNAGSGADPTSVTINGVAATKLAGASGSTQGANYSWWIADVPTGTTGVTINATWGSNRTRAGVAVWPIYGADTVSLDSVSGAPSGTISINIAADRYAFAMSHIRHSAQYYFGIGDDYFASSSVGHSITANLTSFTGITYRTRQSVDSGGTVNQLECYAISLHITEPVPAVEKDLVLDYSIALQKDVILKYDVLSELDKSLVLLWDVAPKITKDLVLSYMVQLYKDLGLRWKLENAPNLYYDYHIIRQGTSVLFDSNFGNTVAGPVLSAQPAVSTGLVIPDVTPLPAAVGSEYLYFYADYYLRIWLDPNVRRLSNPRLNTPYSFSIWNAFPNQNYLVEAIKTDLTGVTLVDTVPVLFERYEYKTLSFEIDSTAPASLDGTFEFVFDYGDALLRIIATVVEVTRLVPNEPVTELWVWKTTVTIAEDGSEQRAALRNQPRYRLNCTVNIKDEEDRLVRYNQLWAFLSRDIRMPFFQYMTPLLADASIGDTVLSIDTSATDLRANEYASLYDPNDGTMAIVKVVTIGPDYVVLETGIDVDVTDEWSIVPTVAMRMPDGTGIRMAAVNGVASISAESVQYRDLVRDAGAASVTTFDGYPVLTLRPIAVEDLVENFSQGSGVVDNETALPQLYSFWSTPFVNGSRQWKIERSDVDFWRIFMDEVKGMLNPFLLPTFRNDLPIYTMPALSSNKIEITNVDYAAQWENDTYKRIQIESDNGVVYRKVTSFVDPGNGRLELTLDSPIGSNPGDNNIIRISHLNKVRLASDTVTLEHYVNWTIVSIDVRTINT